MSGWFSDTQQVRLALEHHAEFACGRCKVDSPCLRCDRATAAVRRLVENLAEITREGRR